MGLRRTRRALIAPALTGLLVAALIDAPAATAVQAYPLPASGTITVLGHGLGHGHGMSQYGARGAAAAGLSSSQIVAFYYPGTTLATLAAGTQIRVLLSGGFPYPTVAATAGLTLRDASGALMRGVANPLPTTGISRYRLAPAGAGLTLQRLVAAGWANVPGATALPARADFLSPQGYVWLNRADGGSTAYRDKVGAIRNGAGVMTINRVDLEHYTMGVVPREMPSSWAAAAVHAQAIAARTYAAYEMAHAGGGSYDICDTTQCQVYGGMRHYDSRWAPRLHRRPRGGQRHQLPGVALRRPDDLLAVLGVRRRLDGRRRAALPRRAGGPLRQRGVRRSVPELEPHCPGVEHCLELRAGAGDHDRDHRPRRAR